MRSAVLMVALGASVAWADIAGESPRTMLAEVKLGPYKPLIDRQFTSKTGPYQTVFGDGPMILGELVLEYELFQKLGIASAGVSLGYAEKFAHALDAATGEAASQSTGLRVVPIKAYLTYRFDWAMQKKGIPLVPYVKAGLVMMPWWVTNGSSVEVADGVRGSSVNYGFHGTLGLALVLDFLDQRLARDFDTGMGVNHTFLFAAYAYQDLTNFGQKVPPLDLSSQHWMFGLAFEL